jgi:hypothetical protein
MLFRFDLPLVLSPDGSTYRFLFNPEQNQDDKKRSGGTSQSKKKIKHVFTQRCESNVFAVTRL